MRALVSAAMIITLSIGLLGQAAAPHPVPRVPTSEATPAGEPGSTPIAAKGGCNDLADYTNSLNRAASDSGKFLEVLNSSTLDYSTLTPAEGKQMVADGETLITTVNKLDVPPVYTDGNKGIVLLLTFLKDEVSFYTIDSSTVPDVNSYSDAIQLIYNGETRAAKECPKEIKSLGGYIFIDPKQIEDQVVPGN